VAAGRTIYRQEQVSEDKSRLVRKLSELYHFGRMHNAASIHVMLANFWLFGVLAIKDFAASPPDIWAACGRPPCFLPHGWRFAWDDHPFRRPRLYFQLHISGEAETTHLCPGLCGRSQSRQNARLEAAHSFCQRPFGRVS
jgi:hypothetical protein